MVSGYFNTTQAKPSNFRRRHRLKALFKDDSEEEEENDN